MGELTLHCVYARGIDKLNPELSMLLVGMLGVCRVQVFGPSVSRVTFDEGHADQFLEEASMEMASRDDGEEILYDVTKKQIHEHFEIKTMGGYTLYFTSR